LGHLDRSKAALNLKTAGKIELLRQRPTLNVQLPTSKWDMCAFGDWERRGFGSLPYNIQMPRKRVLTGSLLLEIKKREQKPGLLLSSG
jgi:hypothetical protein